MSYPNWTGRILGTLRDFDCYSPQILLAHCTVYMLKVYVYLHYFYNCNN